MNKSPSEALDPRKLRASILNMAFAGSSVHIGCAFSLVEVLSTLHECSNIDVDESRADRDRLVLSKGHGVMALYAIHRERDWLEQSHLDLYFSDGSALHGLCEAKGPGFEVCSGSLGHGLPIAVGMALGLKRTAGAGRVPNVYCVVGDGEMNEGTMWEALLFAGHHRLDNLTVIVDANGYQAMGTISSIIDMEPFAAKFASFGFDAMECDGHDTKALRAAYEKKSNRPKAIVARTVKGKGVSFMEGKNEWHYLRLNPEMREQALREVMEGVR